jgi:hypothetical protein
VLEPLYPDRLGEDFLGLQTPGSGHDDFDPDPWAVDAAGPLLAFEAGTDPPPWTRSAITILAAAAERWPHLRPQLSGLLQQTPQLALAAGGAALAAIAELPDIELAALEAVERLFPHGGNADLDVGIAAVTARLTAHRFEATDKPDEQAALMFTLATRLANAGDRQEAFAAAMYAGQTYSDLATADPARYEPEFAKSLTEIGMLSDDPEVSLEATEAAVEIYQRLVGQHPGSYDLRLARALNNLGNHHPDPSTFLKAATDAVEIYGRLAESDPAAHEAEYAGALGNLAHRLSELGCASEALAEATSALAICRRLVQADAPAYEPQLAILLNNLGILSDAPEKSLAAAQEAVEIGHRLARANPARYEQQLAVFLDNLALRHLDLKQGPDALAAAQDAVAAYQRLTDTDLVRYEPYLAAQSLKFARLCVAEHALLPEAKQAAERALAIYQRMQITQPGLVFTDFEQVQCRFVGADVLERLGQAETAERIRKALTDAGWRPS